MPSVAALVTYSRLQLLIASLALRRLDGWLVHAGQNNALVQNTAVVLRTCLAELWASEYCSSISQATMFPSEPVIYLHWFSSARLEAVVQRYEYESRAPT